MRTGFGSCACDCDNYWGTKVRKIQETTSVGISWGEFWDRYFA